MLYGFTIEKVYSENLRVLQVRKMKLSYDISPQCFHCFLYSIAITMSSSKYSLTQTMGQCQNVVKFINLNEKEFNFVKESGDIFPY